ncbi:hypothetical protein HU200_036565 [Digitaria exilis]|uniref:NADP-dependent oxidoreductase domain-containing protein n=1 Tax=Digitaria exilis TaxID=1010633 RepID=A0A835BLW2_9POAL|nr:hypothetical protein HU200_036565 [Digitaria exilis]
MGLSGAYNSPLADDAGIAVISHAFSRGVTFFDTSNVYGPLTNEILLGKALKQLPREQVQVATKFGIQRDASGVPSVCGKPEYVRACCEASLGRLGIDCIDLYYQHRIDTTIPIEETVSELKKLVEEGKVKYIGLSEASPDTIRRAHAPLTHFILLLCQHGIPRFAAENLEKNKQIYLKTEELANKHQCSPAQLALAWVLHQGDDVVPIPGTTKIKNLDANIDALKVKLTDADLKEISSQIREEDVAGGRQFAFFQHATWKYADTPKKQS